MALGSAINSDTSLFFHTSSPKGIRFDAIRNAILRRNRQNRRGIIFIEKIGNLIPVEFQ